MQLGRFTEIETRIFNINEMGIRPYEYRNNIHLSISYEGTMDLYRVSREVYNLLDWLGDIGGLSEALVVIFSMILAVL